MGHQITHKRLSGGATHEHIVAVAWTNDQTGHASSSTTQQMVEFIESGNPDVYTLVGGKRATVGVRTSDSGRKFLQTYADRYYNNNLLALPDF